MCNPAKILKYAARQEAKAKAGPTKSEPKAKAKTKAKAKAKTKSAAGKHMCPVLLKLCT